MKTSSNNSNSNSEQLIQRIEIENTPFTAIKCENEPYFLTFGKYRISGYESETLKEMKTKIEQNKWNLITLISSIIAEHILTNNTTNNGNN